MDCIADMADLTPLRRSRIDSICRSLVARFATAMNRHDGKAMAAVLAPDLLWETPGVEALHTRADVCRGLNALWCQLGRRDLWLDLDTARTCSIEVESQSEARGSTWLVMYGGTGSRRVSEMIGCCRHRFIRTPQGWRIAEHRATTLFRSPSTLLPVAQRSDSPQIA